METGDKLMTVLEAIESLTKLIHNYPELSDKPLEIPTVDTSIGYRSAAKVEAISQGIDWDSGRVFLYTDKALQEAKKK